MTTTIQETLLPMKKDIQTVGSANLEIFSDVKMKIVNLNALMDFSIQEKAPMKYMMDTLVRNSTTSWQIFFFPQKTMTNLEKTSAEIRRLVPRLMELRRGCMLINSQGNCVELLSISTITKPRAYTDKENNARGKIGNNLASIDFEVPVKLVYFLDDINNWGYSVRNEYIVFQEMRDNLKKIKKIIGHPITKEDVEEAFEIKTGKDLIHNDWNFQEELNRLWIKGKPYDQQPTDVHGFVARILFN